MCLQGLEEDKALWHFSRYHAELAKSEGSGFKTREAAVAGAKKFIRNEGISGFHKITTFQTISDDSGAPEIDRKSVKVSQYVLNVKKIRVPETPLIELLDIARNSNDIAAEKEMFIKLQAILFNSRIRHKYVRPILNYRRSHIEPMETFAVGGKSWNKGGTLCNGEYVGRQGICYNCVEQFALYQQQLADGVRPVWKTRKALMLVDDNMENTSVIRSIVRNEEIIITSAKTGIANARDKAMGLDPDLTLINIVSPQALQLAEEMRRNGMNVILYGDIKTQDAIKADPSLSWIKAMSMFVPLPRTAEEMAVFSKMILDEIRRDDNEK